MSKKTLPTSAISNELQGASLFFTPQARQPASKPQRAASNSKPRKRHSKEKRKQISDDTVIPRHHETMKPRYRDTMTEGIRKAVKEFGKEAATHRFTETEKRAIAEIIFTYKGQKISTSENEVARIGINFIVSDYKENGENSVLHKVLKALNE